MNKTCYLQTNSLWGGLGYPKAPWYIRNCGCGEVAVTNCLIELEKYSRYTPKTTQPYMKQFAESRGNGTYHYGIPTAMKHYGLEEVNEHATMSSLWKELKKGNRIAVLLMGSRNAGSNRVHWTGSGHFVAVTGYKEKDGKHYVYVKDSASTSKLRNGWITYEGNIRGACLKCWSGKLSGKLYNKSEKKPVTSDGKLVIDGIGGEATVKAMQRFFGTVQDGIISGQNKKQAQYFPSLTAVEYGKGGSICIVHLQKWVGVKTDGELGKGTVAAWQKKLKDAKYYTGIIDGYFGTMSMEAWQKYLNDNNKAVYPTATPTKKDKMLRNIANYCWAYGTNSKKWSYKTGYPTSNYVSATPKASRIKRSDCGFFVRNVLKASGIADWNPLDWGKVPSALEQVHSGGVIKDGELKEGDIIAYKKKDGQHTMIYLGNGKIAEAGRKLRFPVIRKDSKKYNADNVKHSTIKVYRVK